MRQSSRTYRIGKCEGDRGVTRDTFAHWQQKATVPALSRNEMNQPYDNRRSVFKVKIHDLIIRGCKAASPRRGFFFARPSPNLNCVRVETCQCQDGYPFSLARKTD
jgi:hypothetical protein